MVGRIEERERTAGRAPLLREALASLRIALCAAACAALAAAAGVLPALAQGDSPAGTARPGYFVSEIVDSTYFVGPAEFFALDLPASMRGASAVKVFGEVSVVGSGKRDIIVRLFQAADYQNWLKRRGGNQGKAFWVSPRSRTVRLDQNLPAGSHVVLLLDNGYSIRTPKRVRVQIQLHFQEGSGGLDSAVDATPPKSAPPEEGEIVPRGNTEEEVPPPPPPPPDDATN
jgi:hypothetical protein